MIFTLPPIAVILFITAAINGVVFYISWRRRNSNAGLYFSLAMLGIFIWSLGAAFDYAVAPLRLKILFSKVEALGYLSAIPLFAATSIYISNSQRWLDRFWFRSLLTLIPLASILLVWTNELHHLIWSGFEVSSGHFYVFHRGEGYRYMMIAYYSLLVLIFYNLWTAARKGTGVIKQQARLMMIATLLPFIANLFYQLGFGVEGLDWTSVTFSLTGLIFLYALYGASFLDVINIARDRIIEQMDDSIFVLDWRGRLADFNPQAGIIFEIKHTHLWKPFEQTPLASLPQIAALLSNRSKKSFQEIEIGEKTFDMTLTPLEDRRARGFGQLVALRDISERKKNEQELRDAQKLVLAQQQAFAKMEERQRLARDIHDSVNQSIHSLMLFSETLTALLEKNKTEEALRVSQRIQESGQRALKEIRLLLYKTQTEAINENISLLAALEERLNLVERRVGIAAEIIDGDTIKYFPSACLEDLYWLIMEALNNSLKYSRSPSVMILFKHENGKAQVEVADEGAGFDTMQVRYGGFGMRSMRERAILMGGDFSIQSSPGKGTRVHFKIQEQPCSA